MRLAFDCKPGFRNNLILSLLGFGMLGLLLSAYTIGSSYYSVSGYGDWGLPSQEMVTWLCLLGMVVMTIAAIGFFVTRLRCPSLAVFIGAGLLVTMGRITSYNVCYTKLLRIRPMTKGKALQCGSIPVQKLNLS